MGVNGLVLQTYFLAPLEENYRSLTRSYDISFGVFLEGGLGKGSLVKRKEALL